MKETKKRRTKFNEPVELMDIYTDQSQLPAECKFHKGKRPIRNWQINAKNIKKLVAYLCSRNDQMIWNP